MARILLIDDDWSVRTTLREILERSGYDVVTAVDGKEGLKVAHEQRFDAAVVDIIMPNVEGMETIFELRSEFRDMPIIAMSGGSSFSTEYLDTAEVLGATTTMGKPFTKADLLRTIERVLSRTLEETSHISPE